MEIDAPVIVALQAMVSLASSEEVIMSKSDNIILEERGFFW